MVSSIARNDNIEEVNASHSHAVACVKGQSQEGKQMAAPSLMQEVIVKVKTPRKIPPIT